MRISDWSSDVCSSDLESPVFDPRERAVLAWTEALTNVAQTQAPDADFEPLRDFFSEAEMTKITVAIGIINVWNRLCVAFRSQHPVDALAHAACRCHGPSTDRKSVVSGKSVSGRVDLGGRRIVNKKNKRTSTKK